MFKPTKYAVKAGKGTSTNSILNAVDKAMLNASVGNFNLIKVSSMLPKGIEMTREVAGFHGEFMPAVISKATGSESELVAGIAWGVKRDGYGGYVVEHSSKGDKGQNKNFKADLKKKLVKMAEARDEKLKSIDVKYSVVKPKEGEYGCAMTVLVYLP